MEFLAALSTSTKILPVSLLPFVIQNMLGCLIFSLAMSIFSSR